jgi:8-oxo-dGTP diphosphatase
LVLVGTYSDPSRDPRGHTVSIAFATVLPRARPRAGDDAATAVWVADWRADRLAFDHDKILRDAYRIMRRRIKIAAPK